MGHEVLPTVPVTRCIYCPSGLEVVNDLIRYNPHSHSLGKVTRRSRLLMTCSARQLGFTHLKCDTCRKVQVPILYCNQKMTVHFKALSTVHIHACQNQKLQTHAHAASTVQHKMQGPAANCG